MALQLVAFPAEIVGLILDLSDMSCSTMQLWKCGNRALQRLIAQGVTRLCFVDHRGLTLSRFPIFVENLNALRELTIDRDYRPLLASTDVWKSIRKLTPTLKKLELRYANSYRALHLPRLDWDVIENAYFEEKLSTSLIHAVPDAWSVKEAFPTLESLDVFGQNCFAIADLQSLPPTLTSLGWRVPTLDFGKTQEHIEALPRGLLRLKTYCENSPEPAPTWRHLPRGLTYLEHAYENSTFSVPVDEMQHLPPTLTETKNVFYVWPNLEHLSLLPTGLTELECNVFEYEQSQQPDLTKFTSLKSFGTGHYEYIELLPQTIRALPSSIIYLRTQVNIDELEQKDWPCSMTKLKVRVPNGNFAFDALPSNLVYLKLAYSMSLPLAVDLKLLANLPRTLRTLSCSCKSLIKSISLPPGLTQLSLLPVLGEDDWCTFLPVGTEDAPSTEEINANSALSCHRPRVKTCFPFQDLPPSITKLRIDSYLPASRLKFLPKALEKLRVFSISEDVDFDPSDALNLRATAEVHAVGRAHGICDFPDCSTTTSIAALLPRTLKSLNAELRHSQPFNWKAMPTRLERLQIDTICPTDLLLDLKLDHMQSCDLKLSHRPSDEHFKALPRHLHRFWFSIANPHYGERPPLSRQAILHLCPDSISSWLPSDLYSDWKALTKLRNDAMLNSDPKVLTRLLSLDASILEDLSS